MITSGYPTDCVEDAVQADIAAAKYAGARLTSGPALTIGSIVSLRAALHGSTAQYLAHTETVVGTQAVSASSSIALKQQASWVVQEGLGNSDCFSFESVDTPGSYVRHAGFALLVNVDDGTRLFAEDATFCTLVGLNGQGNLVRSWNYPTRYVRHYQDLGFVASNGGVQSFDAAANFHDDVSWLVEDGLAQ